MSMATKDAFDESRIFKQAMAGKWGDLVAAYKQKEFEQAAKITKAEDTILHMAVYTGNISNVKRLVKSIRNVEVLKAANKKGNTPLHLAAALGYQDFCEIMINREKMLQLTSGNQSNYEKLIMSRNELGESPFFRSVFHGRRQVFRFFLNIIDKEHSEDDKRALCRRTDGDTVLHCSIGSEFFDLALKLVDWYPDLTNTYNVNGLTPLQVLANHPSVFPSSSPLKLNDNLIYLCTWVDPVDGSLNQDLKRDEEDDTSNSCLPKNYEIFEKLVKGIASLFSKSAFSWEEHQSDPIEILGDQRIKDLEEQKFPGQGLTLTQIPSNNQGAKLELQVLDKDGRCESSQGINIKGASVPTAKTPIVIKSEGDHMSGYLPPNYMSFVYIIKQLFQITMIPFGFEFGRFQRIKSQKAKHMWAAEVMKKLVERASFYKYENTGMIPTIKKSLLLQFGSDISKEVEEKNGNQKSDEKPNQMTEEKKKKKKKMEDPKETPILRAARLGIVEMVEKIAETFPVAIHDTDSKNKNIVLLAVEHRQPLVYSYLKGKYGKKFESIFQEVDSEGNSALHLAAKAIHTNPWRIPGAALQMQWETKWFKYIEESKPMNFFAGFNQDGETPNDVFSKTHTNLIEEGGKWLTSTSQSCSVVAALIATVAFASSATVPGGLMQDQGFPVLANKLPFKIFAAASLVALFFSVTSLVMFLAILTSRYEEKDFHRHLPLKLIIGLTSLYVSLTATLVAFSAGHFFVLPENLKYAALPIYTITCLPISFFALLQFPLYVDLLRCTLAKVPLRKYKTVSFL